MIQSLPSRTFLGLISFYLASALGAKAGAQSTPPSAPAPAAASTAEASGPGGANEVSENSAVPDKKASEGQRSTELQSVVVTAQRREENLQDVPVAITAIQGEVLNRMSAIKTANDITQFIPNASASATDGRTRPRWFLRGIGTNETAASTVSPIGIYADDVYLNNVYIQGFPLFDLERVEVLRGPQGTLWGKNTTGGAIHYISKKPSFDTEGYARLGIGSFQEQLYQGAVGGPIFGEQLAARVSFYNESRDGWVDNLVTGRKDGAVTDSAIRAQLLFTPTDELDALIAVKYRRLSGDKSPSFYFQDPTQTINNPIYAGPGRGRDAIAQAGISQELLESDGVSARLNWYAGGHTLTSITAYDRGKRILLNGSSIAADISRSRAFAFSRQITEELRLASPTTGFLSWIIGGYVFSEELTTSSVNRLDSVPGAGATPEQASPFGFDVTRYGQSTLSYAPFASATAELIDSLSLSAGLRWSAETKDFDLNYQEAPDGAFFFENVSEWWNSVSALGDPLVSSDSHSWHDLTYDATLRFEVSESVNTYARYAHGFRAGGFVVAADNTITQLDPETLNAIELGVKTQWLDGQLTFNSAFFNYDYQDIIVGVLLPVPGTTDTRQVQENAGAGYSRGAEFELSYWLGERLRLGGSIGLLKTEYTNYSSSTSGQTIDANGNSFTRSPDLSATLDAEVRIPITRAGDSLGVGADVSYRTRQYFNAVNQSDPALSQAGYALGNASVFYRLGSGKLTLSAFVRNVTDSVYSVLATGPSRGVTRQVYGLPRSVGSSLQLGF